MSTVKTNAILDASGGETATVNGYTPTLSNMPGYNRIINGDMRIDQRNAGASVTPTNAFTLDRWLSVEETDGAISVQQVTDAPSGFDNSAKITITTADASIGANQFTVFAQYIEGYNVSDCMWGTANAKTITLSFWVKCSATGTFGAYIRNADNNYTYPYTYTISAANTWEYKTVTIAGPTAGTWNKTNGRGMAVGWSLAAGSNLVATAGSWAAVGYLGATGQTQLQETLNATWQITGVQLEVGSVATPFERRPFGTELSLCQRYYEVASYAGKQYHSIGNANSGTTTSAETIYQFKVSKRAVPTMSYASGANYYFFFSGGSQLYFSDWTLDSNYVSTEAVNVFTTGISGATVGRGGSFRQSDTSGFLAFSAEL